MTQAILALALSLMSVCVERPDVGDWPPDVGWIRMREGEAESHGQDFADALYERKLTGQHAAMLGSDVIVLGSVKSVRDSLALQDTRAIVWRCHVITVTVEECIKGECQGDEVKAHMRGGFVGATPPTVGTRYVFFLRQHPILKAVRRGGGSRSRFLIEDDVVVRKAMELGEFLSITKRHLSSRSPESLYRTSDAVVLGTVLESEVSISSEGDAHSPGDHNFVRLSLEEVARGPLAAGDTLDVRLGYHSVPEYGVYEAYDYPWFVLGERVVVFLCEAENGEWSPAAGADSRLPLRPDGSFLWWESLSELADDARE